MSTTTEDAPLIVMDPVLMDALAALDRDVSGEQKFCRNAAAALRAFLARWDRDLPVADGYASAIVALDNMDSILAGALSRTTQDVTATVLGTQAAVQSAQTAQAAREHAMAWADTPPPPAAPPPTTSPESTLI